MSTIRHVYLNTDSGKRKAISNLQFALEDSKPWYMCTKYRPNATAIAKGRFTNWIIRENFDLACKAIRYALEPIYFYQFEDMPELNLEASKSKVSIAEFLEGSQCQI